MADLKSYVVLPEDELNRQIESISTSPAYEDQKIRIMPDAHFGKGSCVGFTSTYSDKIVPNTVGVDIACRVSHLKLPITVDDIDVDWFDSLDTSISRFVPSGFKVRRKPDKRADKFPYDKLHYWQFDKDKWKHLCAMGTLGGGNHYIELDKDEKGNVWLAVHTGSRNLGLQVCQYYQKIANENHPDLGELAYIEGEDMENYLNDMRYCNLWSYENHMVIMNTILVGRRIRFNEDEVITCIHNYVDVDNGIIRKGAISAKSGEYGAIPLNMRDGTLIVKGKGEDDWNYSLPHGAGRAMSRGKARKTLKLEDFENEMKGIYSTSVVQKTIDEAPDVYKPAYAIIDSIRDHAEIVERLTPIYNFKAK